MKLKRIEKIAIITFAIIGFIYFFLAPIPSLFQITFLVLLLFKITVIAAIILYILHKLKVPLDGRPMYINVSKIRKLKWLEWLFKEDKF